MNNHVHVFDSEVYALRYQYSSGKYTGAVDLGCECGARRTFTPSDGQPTKEFWGVDLGKPNPPLPSQPPHLAWDGKIEVADFMPPGEVWLVSGGQFRKIVNIGTGEDQP